MTIFGVNLFVFVPNGVPFWRFRLAVVELRSCSQNISWIIFFRQFYQKCIIKMFEIAFVFFFQIGPVVVGVGVTDWSFADWDTLDYKVDRRFVCVNFNACDVVFDLYVWVVVCVHQNFWVCVCVQECIHPLVQIVRRHTQIEDVFLCWFLVQINVFLWMKYISSQGALESHTHAIGREHCDT